MLTVEVATTTEELLALRPAWNELWSASNAAVFSDFDWVYLWWRSLGVRDTPLVLVARRHGSVVAIAPLMVSGTSKPWVSFFAAPMSDRCDLLAPAVSDGELTHLVDRLLSLGPIWARAKFERMVEGSPAWRLCQLAKAQGLAHNEAAEERYAYVAPPERVAELTAGMAGATGKRRSSSHFRKHTVMQRIDDPAGIMAHLPNLFLMHAQRWRDTETPSRFHSAAERRFFYLIAEHLAPRGLVSLCVLSYLGEPVAYSLDLHRAPTCYRYTLAYSPYYAGSSPGGLLAARGNDELSSIGFTRVDFARGGQAFKQSLATTSYLTHDVEFFRSPLLQKAVLLDATLRDSRAGAWVRSRSSARAARKRLLGRVRTVPDGAARGERALYEIDCGPAAGPATPTRADVTPAVTGSLAASPAAPSPVALTEAATPADLGALGSLYACQAASPEAAVMKQWLAAGAVCLLVRAGTGAVAAGWVFARGSTSAPGPHCPAAGTQTGSLLGGLVGSPAANDVGAMARLLREHCSRARSAGLTPFACLTPATVESLPQDVRCRRANGSGCRLVCETPLRLG